jgi:hypothetical protein
VFRNNRPDEFVDDSPAVSSAQAVLKSVYEATANEYDVRAIQTVRQQWDAVLGRVLGAVHERWSLWVQEVTDEQAVSVCLSSFRRSRSSVRTGTLMPCPPLPPLMARGQSHRLSDR